MNTVATARARLNAGLNVIRHLMISIAKPVVSIWQEEVLR